MVDDCLMSEEEYFNKIEIARKSIMEGRFIEVRNKEELHRYLESLWDIGYVGIPSTFFICDRGAYQMKRVFFVRYQEPWYPA